MEKIKYNSEDILSHHGIAAIIRNEKGDILMQEHTKYGFWTIPVGKVAKGQSVEDGLRQEIFEECNIKIEDCVEVVTRNYTYERDENEVLVTSHLFDILKYNGDVNNNEPQKHKQQVFVSIEKIKQFPYLSDLTLLFLETQGIQRKARL